MCSPTTKIVVRIASLTVGVFLIVPKLIVAIPWFLVKKNKISAQNAEMRNSLDALVSATFSREMYLQNCPKLSYRELKADEGKSALAGFVF